MPCIRSIWDACQKKQKNKKKKRERERDPKSPNQNPLWWDPQICIFSKGPKHFWTLMFVIPWQKDDIKTWEKRKKSAVRQPTYFSACKS